ncbi:MAG: hypothetical protein AB8I08_13060 [Sandaracinaceae bacterium]
MSCRFWPALALSLVCLAPPAQAQSTDTQTVLGPGLYVFQTRTLSATCNDDERTGYVHTFIAPIHGVPGDRRMRMQLTNSRHWPGWDIVVAQNGTITGDAALDGNRNPTPNTPRNHFEVQPRRDRFVGTGVRTYRSEGRTCEVRFDALLRPMAE